MVLSVQPEVLVSDFSSFIANYLLLYSECKKELASHGTKPYCSSRMHRRAPLTILQMVGYLFCQ
jgi:hypothetical protein